MIESVFLEISLVIILAVLISGIMKLLKQPLIIGYIITGIVSGPLILNLVKADEIVTVFSHFGIVFLLFIAGLSLNPKVLRSVGKVSLITGLGQVAFTSIIGFVICVILGFNYVESLYISIALTFSSTIIIIKLLSDKGDLQTLYGRISVGFLIVQDVIAVLMLMIISSFTNGFEAIFSLTLETVLIGAGTLTFIALFSYYALPRITGFFSDSQEFLLLFAIGWLLLLAIIFSYLNFSIEIGALIAGITMSISPYHFEIKSKMNVLRDFFILFFFVLLGSQMVFTNISNYVLPIIIFSLFILVGNPLIVMILMGSMRYTKRNGFLAGLTVAQISEFSLILVSLGVAVGHVTNDTLSLITATGLITIFGSAYLITHANKIYSLISGYLWIFERKGRKTDEHYHGGDSRYDIILFGYNRMGFSLLESLKHLKRRFVVIDFDPEKIAELAKEGYDCRYGDANDTELLKSLNFSKAKMVISTIPDTDTNLLLARTVRERNKHSILIIVSHQIDEALKLYENGATYVVMPYFLGGNYTSTLIEKHGMNLDEFLEEKAKHINHLKIRSRMSHEHPKPERRR